jgi:hypothetical protein
MEERGAKVIYALAGCLGLGLVSLCAAGGIYAAMREGEPAIPPPPPLPTGPAPVAPLAGDPSAREIVAIIDSASGATALSAGAECRFPVTRRDRPEGGYWCNAQIQCGGRLLYGGGTQGFFPCTLADPPSRHVVGTDDQTTASDGDAAIRLDTTTGTLLVQDDARGPLGAYVLTARVTSVR